MDNFPLDLKTAFPDDQLQRHILDHISRCPDSRPLFERIIRHVLELRVSDNGPSSKKRKIEPPTSSKLEIIDKAGDGADPIATSDALLSVPGISFSIPQRKKFRLNIAFDGIAATGPSGGIEFCVSSKSIDYVACLPVPEKATRQWNICVFTKDSFGMADGAKDPILFTINDAILKNASGSRLDGADLSTARVKTAIIDALNQILLPDFVREPSPGVFTSRASKSYFKDDFPLHVNGHLGTKEGFLFFLQDAIVWGFKKPLFCFLFDTIESSSYSSITQRTFSLTFKLGDSFGGKEVEFSMIDQAEHPAIDEYLRKNDLKDMSMSENKKAKMLPSLLKESSGKQSELEAAEAMITVSADDDDDEDDDEDYQDSEREDGSESSDDEDRDTDSVDVTNECEIDSDGDLADELGSELEDVEITDEETKKTTRSSGRRR